MPFSDIKGHKREKDILLKALAGKRAAHAYLFSGPEGTGKLKAAVELVRALNCSSGGIDSCGACPDCVSIVSGAHQNIVMLCPTDKPIDKGGVPDPSGLIRVEQVREAQGFLKYKSGRGAKAVIVDSADRMNVVAANAFLKTLEEPPPDSVIVLVTSKAAELLPTVISRCQRINFRPLSIEDVTAILVDRLGLSAIDAAKAARLGAGSVGRALRLAGEGAYDELSGLAGRITGLSPGDEADAFSLAEELSRRDDIEDVLEAAKCRMRDVAVTLSGEGRLSAGRAQADAFTGIAQVLGSFALIENARRDIMPPRYANKQLALDALFLGLIGLKGAPGTHISNNKR